MRILIALCALGLILAGCGDSPAPPTPVPALPATAAVPGAGSAGTSPAPTTLAPPLVPAFPTSTVAFSGAGPNGAALPFALSGGSYHVSWNEQSIGPGYALPTWTLSASIHDPDGRSNAHPLFSVTVPSAGAQKGVVAIRDIPAGTYVLDATAPATCSWTVSIAP